MQPHTDHSPATAHPPAAPVTGAGPQASTPPDAATLQAFAVANIAWLDAKTAYYRAAEAMYRAQAKAHLADPYIVPVERTGYFTAASNRAEDCALQAAEAQQRADEQRVEHPAAALTNIGAALTAIGADAGEPTAVVVLTIQRDRIQQTARLLMGASHVASRTWDRRSSRSWQTRDPEWSCFENRIGVELVEFMDALALPDRVADMLPRPPAADSAAAAQAAEEVRNG